jgi:hypothetical protein
MSSSAAWQLAGGLLMMLVIFVLASSTKRTVAIGVLLVLIPFQTVETQYASSSVLIAYALAGVLLVNGGLKVRMLPALGLIVLAYLVSLSQASREIMFLHVLSVFQFFSCLVVFLLAYNFSRLVEKERSVIDILLAINILTVVYCLLQLTAGPGEKFAPFGIEALEFNRNRDPHDPRLVGPFANPGSTAGYFSLMALVCAVELMFARDRRRLLVCLLAGFNLVGLVATGNRAGFLVLLAMFPALLFTFRRELGVRRILQYLLGGAAVLAIAATIAVSYTDFGRLFERMETVTDTVGGVPATRTGGWPVAFEKIKRDPWFGEGPHFSSPEDAQLLGALPVEFKDLGELDTAYDPFPHSLYLYLLRTVGVFGLVTVVGFFLRAWRILYNALQWESKDKYTSAILRLGLLLIPAFLVAQITLEFIRPDTMDYAQFIFALMGLLVGASDRGRQGSNSLSAIQSQQPAYGAKQNSNGSVAR